MQTYFVVLAIERFDDLKRQVGYTRAVALLDSLRDDVARCLPEDRPRANRTTIEVTIRCVGAAEASAMLSRLCETLAGEIPIRGRTLRRATVAVAVPCGTGGVNDALIERAEALLRHAERTGTPVVVCDLAADAAGEHLLMEDLHAAMRADALELHYQPKLRARTGAIASAEGLLRWHDPVRGYVSPEVFVAAAERSGDIRLLTDWVIDRAIDDHARLATNGLDCPLYVNISAVLAADPAFVDDALRKLGHHAGRIGFEITETSMMADPEGTLVNLQRLADAGISLSIDDYGSGFSSLAYLQRLPASELKIDRMFVSRLSSGSRDPLLIRSTIDLAHALEMEVTAEGVESAASLALLQVMGCDLVQGFFLSRPLALDRFVEFARQVAAGNALPRPATLAERVAERRRVTAQESR